MIFGHFVGIGSNIGAKIHVSQAIRGLLAISPGTDAQPSA